ncbi:mechanosensitive ion channel [Variovorax sp. J22P240]|uniref:mechanosensitive ion channel family protein n=1 Tax=unclassified Variovorax TaxID=663243 RepID=UPI0025766FF5|nr:MULTISPECIES: mechanosensitive ion channel domain-containing protein [unclassified Variovorax]MDL9998921.1 mechanosensitive ion channel [Variovorax sp. J22P240]MDM0048790.1 mechanosensitive ion channel [Variovorax sp. J22R115]
MDFSVFTQRFNEIHARSVWIEVVVLVVCVGVAWAACRWFGRDQPKDSIWFGERTFDGVLFPLVALVLTDLARRGTLTFQPVFVLRIAVPVFLSLAVIRFFALVLRAVFPASAMARLVERTIWWFAWIGAVLWIIGLLPPVLAELDEITLAFGRTRVSLRTILSGLLSAGLVLVIALWISSTIENRILREAVHDLSMRKVASNAVRALLLLIGLLFALSAVGVDLTALSVLGGALGVGLGFGLQKLAANYVSGFVILLERSIRIGDNVRVDGFEGRITDIKTRYTLVRAGNGRESIVPNESLITSRVENLSQADLKFNITTNIVVGYDSDVAKVQEILCAAAAAQPRVMTDPAPVAFLLNFVPDGLEFSLNLWVSDPDKGRDNLRSAINIAILQGLRDACIVVAHPQRVVRIDSLPPIVVPAEQARL